MILGDRVYLRKYILNLEVKSLSILILVREVSNKIISISEYTIITIYIKNLIDKILRITYLIIEVYIVNNLKTIILINTNILTP